VGGGGTSETRGMKGVGLNLEKDLENWIRLAVFSMEPAAL